MNHNGIKIETIERLTPRDGIYEKGERKADFLKRELGASKE